MLNVVFYDTTYFHYFVVTVVLYLISYLTMVLHNFEMNMVCCYVWIKL